MATDYDKLLEYVKEREGRVGEEIKRRGKIKDFGKLKRIARMAKSKSSGGVGADYERNMSGEEEEAYHLSLADRYFLKEDYASTIGEIGRAYNSLGSREMESPNKDKYIGAVDRRIKRYVGKILNKRGNPEDLNNAFRYAEEMIRIGKGIEKDTKEADLRRRKARGLEETVTTIITILSLGVGLFFFSSNITGNAIGNLTQNSTNMIGAVLLVVGLVAGYFWVRKK